MQAQNNFFDSGDKNKDGSNIIVFICLVILFGMLLSSCYSEKKANDQVYKADGRYPLITQLFCSTRYPPTIGDPVVSYLPGDTLEGETIYVYDTVLKDSIRIKNRFIHDTIKADKKVEDFAKVNYLNGMLTKMVQGRSDSTAKYGAKIAVLEDKVKSKNKLLNWVFGILAGIVVFFAGRLIWKLYSGKITGLLK